MMCIYSSGPPYVCVYSKSVCVGGGAYKDTGGSPEERGSQV